MNRSLHFLMYYYICNFQLFPTLVPKEITEKVDETYVLTDYKPEDENTHHSGGKRENKRDDVDDEDEEQGFRGGRKIPCQNQ